ncbi:hypothetical protein FOE74_09920 [Rufibacter glacialis]|nr:hypothetical protein FOE74_09920 [Rufibacter glacialis]
MKNHFMAKGLVWLLGAWALPEETKAQECLQPLGLSKNTEFVYQVTDKGRNHGKVTNKVVQQAADKKGVYVTTFKSARISNTNRSSTSEEYQIRCSKDTIYVDAMLLLREQVLKTFEGQDFTYSPVDIAYPLQMKVGQKLPNGSLGVKARSTNSHVSQIKMAAINRKVDAQEKITTPAGTFDAFKISYQYVVDLDAMGLPLRDVFQVEEYFSPEHGLIKCQFTTKRGKKAKGLELISKRSPAQALQK